MSIKVGLALNCSIASRCKWDRKSYYYPDLPKNYQISQYDQPLCYEGYLDISLPNTQGDAGKMKRIRIIRAHLEEDAGKLAHEAPGGFALDHSIVDLNRAGTPLLEIVTYPDMHSAEEVVAFCTALRDICRHCGVTEGIMQKGHMRFEPNINLIIERGGETFKTPIVEIKNLNSFRSVHGAIVHEQQRQFDEWLETGKVMGRRAKTTRGWDDNRGVTTLQREKEDADDYRYFPDPDLVEVTVDDAWTRRMRDELPEMPLQRIKRYMDELGLSVNDAVALIDEPAVCQFYEDVLATGLDAKRAATLLLNYGAKYANERGVRVDQLGITPKQIHDIAKLAENAKIGSSSADQLFGYCCDGDEDAEKIAEARGLLQVSDTSALDGWIDEVLANVKNAKTVEDIKSGKDKAVG
ncbi:MAG: Asp-tRNA(Asn)/Glu-tRNA(Gln) amidotransferase subunit GatB, partial [Rhodospirillales bacterium]|nr:Asp-tRNA(Asn)/Glu-tRNA(Gln) amidotransferase subunit GatB [Rhodospirillales bacterium]